MAGPSEDTIAEMLSSEEAQEKASKPETLKAIQQGFGEAFEKVKDRLGDSWEDVQTIYHMAFDDSFDMKKETKYAAIGALAYLVSPVDLIPERFFGSLGMADDVAVLMFALKYAQPEIERYRSHRAAFGGQAEEAPDLA
jgi:uncharacterized membrane protein YkvA (DUF1232 family)